jgi:crossover junction endodeoxyribonuclease RuvC
MFLLLIAYFRPLKKEKNIKILGVDPGTNVLGYALITSSGSSLQLIELGVLHLKEFKEHHLKLKTIYERLQAIIVRHQPTQMAIEAPFFAKNPQSMLKLGRAQGVAIAAAVALQLDVCEYSPKKIKQSVTGNGNATKEQVAAMLNQIMKQPIQHQFLDATDALATAVCHHFQTGKSTNLLGKTKDWKSFIQANPKKIIQ